MPHAKLHAVLASPTSPKVRAAASFNPAKRIGQQIMEGRCTTASWIEARRRYGCRNLTALQLPDPEAFANRYPHQVSGGQLQRAMVAMAMSCRPDILVLDEPTTALDVTTQIEVLALLRSLIQRYDTAALYITHDLAVVAQIADRIMVLRNGRKVELGTAEEVLEAPKEDYTRKLVAEREASIIGDRSPHDAGTVLLEVKSAVAYYGEAGVERRVLPHPLRRDLGGGRRIWLRKINACARYCRPSPALVGNDRARRSSPRRKLPQPLAARTCGASSLCINCPMLLSIRGRRWLRSSVDR